MTDQKLFDLEEEDTLFDAWQMLKYAGLTDEELEPVTDVIEHETSYNLETLQLYYEDNVAE